jgi:hypothetical protein
MSTKQALTVILRIMGNDHTRNTVIENDPDMIMIMFRECLAIKEKNEAPENEMIIVDKILNMKSDIEKRIKLKAFW